MAKIPSWAYKNNNEKSALDKKKENNYIKKQKMAEKFKQKNLKAGYDKKSFDKVEKIRKSI